MIRVATLCFLGLGLTLTNAGPSKPEIYVGINRESLEKGIVGSLEPTVKWQTSGAVADYDIDGGFEMTVSDSTNMPYSVWGRIKKQIGGVGLIARAETKSSAMNRFEVDLSASVKDSKIDIEAVADADESTFSVDKVKLTQGFDAAGGRFLLKPAYSVPAKEGDVEVSYSVSDIKLAVEADMNKQKVTFEKILGPKAGTIKPSINTKGDIELEYSRPIASGVLTAAYKPNRLVELKYKDGPWEATVASPVDDFQNFNKKVDFKVVRSFDVTE